MAERLAAAFGAEAGIADFSTSSAGTHAVIGHQIHDYAAVALAELGGDSSGFAARQLTAKIASSADLVLTMTRAHRDCVLELAPGQLRRTFTLAEAAQIAVHCGAQDVADLSMLRSRVVQHQLEELPDPIGHTQDVFSAVGNRIANLLPPVIKLCSRL